MPWVEEQLVALGIPPPKEPEFECPVIMPGTLSNLSTADYTVTYEKILGWFGYLTEKAAYAKSMVLQCENEMAYIAVVTKKALLDNVQPGAKKPNESAIEIAVETHPRYSELKLVSQKWRQLRDGIQGRLDTVEANMKTVSRHIELRKLDQGGSRQQGNMPGRNRF